MATSLFGLPDLTLASPATAPKNELASSYVFANPDYRPKLANWFTAKPYGFRFSNKNGKITTLFLPIAPSNLTITTNFATNIIPTLYGTVEEHSPVRYYDITIEGTTGMGPKYVDPIDGVGIPNVSTGRTTFNIQQTIKSDALGGFFAKTINTINSVVDGVKSLFGQTPEVSTGLFVNQSGYLAFHNLYRFLLKYKKDASGVDPSTKNVKREVDKDGNSLHPLVFFNYKDNNQYKVAIRNMTLRRDKEDPMLYNYVISMRGYDLGGINGTTAILADITAEKLLTDLGLNGVKGSSFLTEAKKKAADAKAILGSVATGINQLGR